MNLKLRKSWALLAALALTAAPARADVMLTLTDSVTHTTITINDTNGTYTYSAGTGGATSGRFTISGTTENFSNTSGTFTALTGQISFQTGTGVNFGNFSTQITINSNSPGLASGARVNDTNIASKNTGTKTADLIASVTSDGFTKPGSTGDKILLTNKISGTELDSGTASFISGLNGQMTDTANLTRTMVNNNRGSTTSRTVIETSNPFTITNTLTISNMAVGSTANINGTTIATLPEPSTVVMALTVVPLLGLRVWRKQQRKTQG